MSHNLGHFSTPSRQKHKHKVLCNFNSLSHIKSCLSVWRQLNSNPSTWLIKATIIRIVNFNEEAVFFVLRSITYTLSRMTDGCSGLRNNKKNQYFAGSSGWRFIKTQCLYWEKAAVSKRRCKFSFFDWLAYELVKCNPTDSMLIQAYWCSGFCNSTPAASWRHTKLHALPFMSR